MFYSLHLYEQSYDANTNDIKNLTNEQQHKKKQQQQIQKWNEIQRPITESQIPRQKKKL